MTDDEVFEVFPLSYIENASSLTVEPVSTSDWEMIEIHSRDLEANDLLNQVSIVYPDQILHINVNNICLQIKVVNRSFEGKHEIEGNLECLRLVADTELFVKPKPRYSTRSLETKEDLFKCKTIRVLPSMEDFSDAMNQFISLLVESDCNTQIGHLCPPALSIIIHPSTIIEFVPNFRPNDTSFHPIFLIIQKINRQSRYIKQHDNVDTRLPFSVAKLIPSTKIPFGFGGTWAT